MRSPSAPPRSVRFHPVGSQPGACVDPPTPTRTPRPPGPCWLAASDTPSHPGSPACPTRLDSRRPDQAGRQAAPGRKVSKLRGERSPCRQPWTATRPIGSVLLHGSRSVAGGAANYGHFLSCEPHPLSADPIPHPASRRGSVPHDLAGSMDVPASRQTGTIRRTLDGCTPIWADCAPGVATGNRGAARYGTNPSLAPTSLVQRRPLRKGRARPLGGRPFLDSAAPASDGAPRIPAYLFVVRCGRLPLHVSTKATSGISDCDLRNHSFGMIEQWYIGHFGAYLPSRNFSDHVHDGRAVPVVAALLRTRYGCAKVPEKP